MSGSGPAPTSRRDPSASRRRFILLFGVLGWGVPCALLVSLVEPFRHGFAPGWYLARGYLLTLALMLALFGTGGVFLGAWVFERFARRCRA